MICCATWKVATAYHLGDAVDDPTDRGLQSGQTVHEPEGALC